MQYVLIILLAIILCTIQVLGPKEPEYTYVEPTTPVMVDTIAKGDRCKMLGVNVTVHNVRKYTSTVDIHMNTAKLLNVKRHILKNCTPQP